MEVGTRTDTRLKGRHRSLTFRLRVLYGHDLAEKYWTCVGQIQLSTHDFDLRYGNAVSYVCTGFGSSVAILGVANWPRKLWLRARA